MLKIKLAVADNNKSYLDRLVKYFEGNYSDKLEVISFTQGESLANYLQFNKINVLLISEAFEVEPKLLKGNFAFAYLVDSTGIITLHDKKAVCKFQRADLIYKEVLDIYSEFCENTGIGFKLKSEGDTRIITFLPCSGGSGGSTLAAACCLNLAAKGKKVLYLNLEQFGVPNVFFNAEGSFCLSDVFYAIKSKKANIALKLESAVKRDESGVYFYDACKTPMDLLEMTAEEIQSLIYDIKKSGLYDYIVIDTDLILNEALLNLISEADSITFVSDGSELSNLKFKRVYETLAILERQQNAALVHKTFLIYNKFISRTSKELEEISGVNPIGVIGDYGKIPGLQVARQIYKVEAFDKIC